ncbi:hypothetical protein BJX99DRAFT_255237 [Aspergillus californicus]
MEGRGCTGSGGGGTTQVAAGYWEEAIKKHLTKLKLRDQDRLRELTSNLTFDRAGFEDLLEPLRETYENRKFHSFLQRLGPIAQHCISFGKAVDVAVGGGPAPAAYIWGGIRLLLEISAAATNLHEKIIDMLENLSTYLPLFEKWTVMFPASDYSDLADSIKKTCTAFIAFTVAGILYFRRSAFMNLLRVFFTPSLQDKFSKCEGQIKLYTRHVKLQLNTADMQHTRKRDKDIIDLLKVSAPRSRNPIQVSFPFRFLQNCIRNDQFFGRDGQLDEMDGYLALSSSGAAPGAGMRSVVLHGLGGCGKSSVAKEYMYRRMNNYDVVLWLYADSTSKLDTQYIALANNLGFDVPERQAVESVLHWINHLSGNLLVVFDNADNSSILSAYWPKAAQGSIIITSNCPTTREEGFAENGIALREFTEVTGSQFLVSLLGQDASSLDQEELDAAQALSRQYGGLPLALRQAASFMRTKNCSPTKFSHLYESRFAEIDSFRIPNYSKTLVDVWNMSLSTLSEDSLVILDIAALLDPDSIPTEMFSQPDSLDSSQLLRGRFMTDDLKVLDALEGLVTQSLVEINQKERSLNIHRFFQLATFRRLSDDRDRFLGAVRLAAAVVRSFLPHEDFTAVREPSSWKRAQRAMNHILSLHDKTHGELSGDGSRILLDSLGHLINYGYQTGQYNLGEKVFRKAQELVKNIPNPDHGLLSEMYFHYTRMTTEDGKLREALDAIQLARFHVDEAAKTNPAAHTSPLYIRIISNQGVAHLAAENYAASEKFHLEAIRVCVALGLQETCSLGNLTQNLGSCYLWWGDLQRAQVTLEEALRQPNKNREGAMYTMGNLLLRLGRFEDALGIHKEVLRIYTETLGPEHLITADSWYKLGCIFSVEEFAGFDRVEAEQALHITQLPTNTGNSISATLTARLQWWLSHILGPASEESQELNDAAMRYLKARLGKDLPRDKETRELFDSLVCYWSR